MNHQEVFKQVLEKVDWVKTIIERKSWDLIQDLIVEEPATLEELLKVEGKLGFKLPEDYRILFTECSKRVEFRYQFDENLSEEFRQIFSGEIYWNLDRLHEMYEDYLGWIEAFTGSDSSEEDTKFLKNKVPLLEVGNGDLIVVGYEPSEVMYFSHECDKMHQKILGKSLFEFLEFHSRIGFVGSEDWQFEPFFDFEKDKMITNGPIVEKFIKEFES